jgi:hypothetical protein
MTREEAYTNWMNASENYLCDSIDLWNAACDFQKEKDAKICEAEVKEYPCNEGSYFARIIRQQEDE